MRSEHGLHPAAAAARYAPSSRTMSPLLPPIFRDSLTPSMRMPRSVLLHISYIVRAAMEMAVMASNNLLYNASAEALSRKLALLRYAASDGGK